MFCNEHFLPKNKNYYLLLNCYYKYKNEIEIYFLKYHKKKHIFLIKILNSHQIAIQ